MEKFFKNIYSVYDGINVVINRDNTNRGDVRKLDSNFEDNIITIGIDNFSRKIHFLTEQQFNDVNYFENLDIMNSIFNGDQFFYVEKINHDNIWTTFDFVEYNAKSIFGEDNPRANEIAKKLWDGNWFEISCISMSDIIKSKFNELKLSDFTYTISENKFQLPEDFKLLPNCFEFESTLNILKTNLQRTKVINDEDTLRKLSTISSKFESKINDDDVVIYEQRSSNFREVSGYVINKNVEFFENINGLIVNGFNIMGSILLGCEEIFGTRTFIRGIEDPRDTYSNESYWSFGRKEIMIDSYSDQYDPYDYNNRYVEEQYAMMNKEERWDYMTKQHSYHKNIGELITKNSLPLNLGASLLFGSRDFPTEEWPNMYIRTREVIRLINDEFRANSNNELPIWKEYVNFYEMAVLEDFESISSVFFEDNRSKAMQSLIKGLKLFSSEVIYANKGIELKRNAKKINKLKDILSDIDNVKQLVSEIIVGIENVANNLDSLSGVRVNVQYLESLKENFDSLFVEEDGSFVVSNNFKFLWPISTGAYENIFDLAISYEGGFYDNNVNKKELRTLMELYSIIDCAIYYYSV